MLNRAKNTPLEDFTQSTCVSCEHLKELHVALSRVEPGQSSPPFGACEQLNCECPHFTTYFCSTCRENVSLDELELGGGVDLELLDGEDKRITESFYRHKKCRQFLSLIS